MTLNGLIISDSFSHECLGVITHAPNGSRFKPGDSVVCLKAGKCDSEAIVSELLCTPCNVDGDDGNIVGLLTPFCAAVYALLNTANTILEKAR